MATETRRRERAEDTITTAWPGELGEKLLAVAREDDAFGALAWRLEEARRDGRDAVQILRSLDEDTLEWVLEDAMNPAAFLASRIAD